MPLSWNEIRDRSLAFSREWADAESERAEAQSFWNDFFRVFGIHRRRVAIFEKQVAVSRAGEKLKDGRIDAFWKGVLLIEHKSADADLTARSHKPRIISTAWPRKTCRVTSSFLISSNSGCSTLKSGMNGSSD